MHLYLCIVGVTRLVWRAALHRATELENFRDGRLEAAVAAMFKQHCNTNGG